MSDPRTDLSAATASEGSWDANSWPAVPPSSAGRPSAGPATVSEERLGLGPADEAAGQVPALPTQSGDGEGFGGQGGAAAFDEPVPDNQPLPLSEADAAEIIGEWDGATSALADGAVDATDGAVHTSGETAGDPAESAGAFDPIDERTFMDADGAGLAESADAADEGEVVEPVDAISAAADAGLVPAEPFVGADPQTEPQAPPPAGTDLPTSVEPSGEAIPAEADWFPSADAPPVVPLYFVGFCLACGYNLRGLGAARCPECGRLFRPTDPASYSPTPGGGPGKAQPRPKPWPRPSSATAAGTFPWSAGTTVDRVAWLERRVRQLALRNGELEGMVRTLIDVMTARGMLTADDLFEIVPPEPPMDADESATEVAEALTQVTDDTPLTAEADVETAALRELQRAVRQRRRL